MINPLKEDAPAFPIPGLQDDPDFNGISARDYFAAKAMCHFIDLFPTEIWNEATYGSSPECDVARQAAKAAYFMADAMLKAREA